MKKVYEKPVLMVEEFELDQTIATGCTVLPTEADVVARSCYKPNSTEFFNGQSAHPVESRYLKDLNGDGKISKSEFDDAVQKLEAAFAALGGGHSDTHAGGLKYNGSDIPSGMFSS